MPHNPSGATDSDGRNSTPQANNDEPDGLKRIPGGLSTTGTPVDEILEDLRLERSGDLDWRGGRAFSLVYNADDPELERLQHEVAAMFLHENALNPFRYQTLLRMEGEILEMAKGLFGAGHAALTSGGTESIFMAVQTARDDARARGVTNPNLVCAITAHPAFAKACHYLGVEMVTTSCASDGRADPNAFAGAINDSTALIVASAPCYPYGVIDPIEEIASLARRTNKLFHVDACLGGYILPFWEALGEQVAPWDFRVEGVTSMSADIHKYGYSFKGTSTVLYRDHDLYQRQIFMYDAWPGGMYASASSAGTRPGAPIAAAWATLTHLGVDGYMRLDRRVLNATRGFRSAISDVAGLDVTSNPDLSVFEFGLAPDAPEDLDIAVIGDAMDDRGWNLDRQQGGLHVMLSPGHDRSVDAFRVDLAEAVTHRGAARDADHVYGGVVD
ncbi:MAG: aspartate aminotransferase family protein [Microthrixaceae bacterium]|nr:aspartate aminotransferase family protein [Microthrixaceae bacterium]